MAREAADPRVSTVPARRKNARDIGLRLASSDIARLALINVLLIVVFSLAAPKLFLTPTNLASMAVQFPGFAILALAMTVPMLTGGVDLSIVALSNLTAILAATIMKALVPADAGSSQGALAAIGLAIVASLLAGAAGGLINGLTITLAGISPILATLSTGLIFFGIALTVTNGSALTGLPAAFSAIGDGTVLGIPTSVAIFAIAAVALSLLLAKTAFGAKVFLLGTNALASRFAGIDNDEITMKTYVTSGIYAALAGIVIAARANSAKADYGSSYLLLSILICVLGGVSPFGGVGRVAGVVLGILALQLLSSGLNILGVNNFATDFVWGALLLAVMAVNRAGVASRR